MKNEKPITQPLSVENYNAFKSYRSTQGLSRRYGVNGVYILSDLNTIHFVGNIEHFDEKSSIV